MYEFVIERRFCVTREGGWQRGQPGPWVEVAQRGTSEGAQAYIDMMVTTFEIDRSSPMCEYRARMITSQKLAA